MKEWLKRIILLGHQKVNCFFKLKKLNFGLDVEFRDFEDLLKPVALDTTTFSSLLQ
jgi:hypothetical protein